MNGDEPDDAPRRFVDGEDAFERLLMSSAQLDEAELAERGRARSAAAARAKRELARRGLRSRVAVALGVVAAAAAAVVVVWQQRPREAAPRVAAERAVAPPIAAPRPVPSVVALEPCPGVVIGSGDIPMIDDFEDRNARLLIQDGRSGAWLSSGDPKSKVSPRAGTNAFPVAIPRGRQSSRFGLHFTGGQLSFGAGIDGRLLAANCYDASRYAGVELWAKGPGRLQVMVSMLDVIERKWGGLCDDGCYDPHRAPIDLSADWQRFRIRWADLQQVGYGKPLAFDAKRLASIQLFVDTADSPFDIWIDDVAFIAKSAATP